MPHPRRLVASSDRAGARSRIVAWRERAAGDGYELVRLPKAAPGLEVVELDNALWQIQSEIAKAKQLGLDREPAEEAAPIDPDELKPDPG